MTVPRSNSKAIIIMATVIIVGALTALQSRINGELSSTMNNAIPAGMFSYGSALVILIVIVLFSRKVRVAVAEVPSAVRNHEIKWWQIGGGVFGGFFIAMQCSVVPLIGVAVFTIAIVFGRVVNALVVDRIGLGPGGKVAITLRRVAGAVITLIAVVLAVAPGVNSGSIPFLPVVLAFIAGMVLPVQVALAGRVSTLSGQPLSAAFVNFLLGSIVLGVALGFSVAFMNVDLGTMSNAPWWAYLGGAIGVVYVSCAAWAVSVIGVLLFALLCVCGQLIGSLLLELLAPIPGAEVTPEVIAGVLLALVAVVVASSRDFRPGHHDASH